MKTLRYRYVKQVVIYTLLIMPFFSMAQNINTTVASDVNTVFSLLEKNRIPHNILIDYGYDFIDIAQYNGVLQTNNYMTVGNYKELYNTLVSSATATGISGLTDPMQEQLEWANLQKQANTNSNTTNSASIVLNGLLYNYSKINSNALANNKIVVTGGKYDDKYINGVWQNPYDTNIIFAMASPANLIYKANVSVTLPSTLWHTNATISNIDINFGNSPNYVSLNNGTAAGTTYTAVGDYTWTYRVQLTNGQYKYCRQKVHVSEADSGAQAKSSSCSIVTLPLIQATRAYQGITGSATVQISYGSSDCKLRKPLIVAEGLDTGFFASVGRIGDNDIRGFFEEVENSGSDDLRDLITNDTSIDYDVVYVNWNNGTDYIQRNAYVLQAVINYVNQQKAINGSTEDNVVLGQSMGGLIARYALRDMENRSENHDTRLYISHDAPHQGAHVPLGFLYFARHTVDQFIQTPIGGYNIPVNETGNVSLTSIEDLLDAPAVKQMLINNVNANLQLDNSMHTSWQNELKVMGYPQQTRNISLSNASHCAETQGLVSNEILLDVSFDGNTSALTDLVLFVTGLGSLVGDYFDDTLTFLLGFLPGNTKLDGDFTVRAFPSSGTAQVYRGRLVYEKTFLWLVPIRRTITDRAFNSPSGVLFLDNYPGGVNELGLNFVGSDYESNFAFSYGYDIYFNPNFGFIPVTSVLDVGSNNATLAESDYLKVYTSANPPTGSKSIPFNNFTTSFETSSANEPHISFNRLNGDWLAEEIDGDSVAVANDFNCPYMCNSNSITGIDILCTSSTYSVNSESATVTWSSSPSYAVSFSTTTGNSTTITKKPSYTGPATIRATISGDCGDRIITKSISVGQKVMISWAGPGPYGQIDVTVNVGSPPYKYYKNGSLIYTYSSSGTVTIPFGCDGGTLKVEANTACGIGSASDYIPSGCYGNSNYNYMVSPNPSNTSFNVTERSKSEELLVEGHNKKNIVKLELLDFTGNAIRNVKFSEKTLKREINLKGLAQGHYFLRIVSKDNVELHKVVIK